MWLSGTHLPGVQEALGSSSAVPETTQEYSSKACQVPDSHWIFWQAGLAQLGVPPGPHF
jgi:hypothetical protein